MESPEEKKAWREIRHSQRFLNAFHGLQVFWEITRQRSIHVVAITLVIIFGFYFKVSSFEWIALVFCIGFVVISEVFNTAIEIDIDLTSPEYHPYARDTKDVAAAAVFISILVSAIVGLIIFLPKVMAIF